MNGGRVESVPVPAQRLVSRAFPRIDYADAYRIELAPSTDRTVDDITRSLFSDVPSWIISMMRLRNAIVRRFGLKTSFDPEGISREGRLAPGDRVGIFHVYDRTDDEVLMGDDDRHLDYRVSVFLERESTRLLAVVTTVVRFNKWTGRLYFWPVRPVHRLVVRAILRRAAGR